MGMMRRASPEDTEQVKAICEQCGMPADPERWLADPRNVILIEGDNAALCLWRWIGIYEIHALFTARGKTALGLAQQWIEAMLGGGAQMMLCVIPKKRKQAIWFARKAGFQFRGDIETIEGLSEMYQLEAAR
jgi:hypothetical protein